jgi:hypothetical protein
LTSFANNNNTASTSGNILHPILRFSHHKPTRIAKPNLWHTINHTTMPHNHQQLTPTYSTHSTILTVTDGSNTESNTKRQRQDYYEKVNHVAVKGPITQTKWSHIPVTFTNKDINLASFPHINAMVITVHINRWDDLRILIDNVSQAEILFLSAFKKMGYDMKQLREPTKPLYGFGGKRIKPSHRIHNLRCHRDVVSLQRHFWMRLIEYL